MNVFNFFSYDFGAGFILGVFIGILLSLIIFYIDKKKENDKATQEK